MATKDFIISFFAGSPLLKKQLDKLQQDFLVFEPQISGRKYKEFVQTAGNSVVGLWNKARKRGDDLGRVAVIGFSEGCQGVSAVLECTDASGIDVVIPVDGIHRQFTDPITQAINPVGLANYIAFAKMAASTPPSVNPDGKLMVITHSSIGRASLPKELASTTQTAEVIWTETFRSNPPPVIETQLCGWPCPAAIHETNLANIHWPDTEFPVGTKLSGAVITPQGWTTVRPTAPESGNLPPATFTWDGFADGWMIRRIANNLYIFGWSYDTPNKTKDPTGNRDHVFQAQMVLPAVANEMFVTRWNPKCEGPVNGLGLGAQCTPGNGRGFNQQELKPLPSPYPMGIALPVLPERCPLHPGETIIGTPGDPCWTGPQPPSPPLEFPVTKALGVVAGGALGYFGGRYLMKSLRSR